MIKKVTNHIHSTLRINPEAYSERVSPNRVQSFGYALAGILHMLRYAKNVRLQILAALLVFIMAAWLRLNTVEWAVIVIVIMLNGFAEFVNAAIEATINMIGSGYHPMAQVAKDVAAGSVLLMTLMAVAVGLLIIGPPLWEKIF
ncbi:MAG: diacylglycerol kinase family protein [Anaerolineae bacterium]|nr:diacylglycerol kinase family protein [Anaerolineae bacterium]